VRNQARVELSDARAKLSSLEQGNWRWKIV
jgi:hypothetical protein